MGRSVRKVSECHGIRSSQRQRASEHDLAAYWHGARNPRRRVGRRATDLHLSRRRLVFAAVLAIPVLTILGLCVLDGMLTVMLMSHGAREAQSGDGAVPAAQSAAGLPSSSWR